MKVTPAGCRPRGIMQLSGGAQLTCECLLSLLCTGEQAGGTCGDRYCVLS